jgi:hypothetical protein
MGLKFCSWLAALPAFSAVHDAVEPLDPPAEAAI